jgi:hypothetical protein
VVGKGKRCEEEVAKSGKVALIFKTSWSLEISFLSSKPHFHYNTNPPLLSFSMSCAKPRQTDPQNKILKI